MNQEMNDLNLTNFDINETPNNEVYLSTGYSTKQYALKNQDLKAARVINESVANESRQVDSNFAKIPRPIAKLNEERRHFIESQS